MPSPRRTRRTLYSSPKTEDKTAFRWGIKSKHPSDVAISRGLRYYKSFTWENEHYEIGDHVLVAGEEDSQPYVAKLEELCDVSDSLSDMNYQGKVTWYARPDELKHKKLDRKLGKNEVVLLGGSGPKATSRLLDLETICGHCSVVVVSEEISSVAEEDEKGRQQYFCRYSLTGRSSLKPLKTSELKSLKKGDFYGYDASEFRDPIVQVEDIKATPQKSLKMKFKKTDKENFEIRTSPVKTPSRRALKAPDTVEKLAKNLDGVSLVNQRTPLRATRNGTTDILGTPKSSKAERTTTTRYGRSVRTLFSPEKVPKPLEKEAELSDGDLVNEDNDYNISTENENDSSSSETSEGDSSSDDESNNRTGRKARASRAANKTPRSKAKIIAERRSAVTPSMPSRRAKAQQPQTDIERALSKLHVCAVPDQLPCREDQFAEIYDFVEGKLVDQVGSCMYISGVPGTGKTATVREVIRTLQDAQAAGDVPEFRFIEINGMKLSEPNQAYVQILRQLNGRKATAENAADILTEIFKSKRKSSDAMTVLLVDELDLLWTRKQQVLYNIFDWPTHPNSRLVVVAIANTMDLPERMVMNKVASRMGLSRMTFQPYTFQELQEIVKARLTGLELMDPDAVQFISRKVAALSGDARRALDVCRRAVELSESGDGVQASPSKRAKKYAVTMMHVNKAVKEMFTSSKIVAMQALSFHEKLALRAIVAEFRRTGVEECVFHNVNSQYMTLARLEGVAPLRSSLLSRVLARMASSRLLILSDPKNDFQQKISLNATADDVNFALREQNDCDE